MILPSGRLGFLVEGGADEGALPILTAKVLKREIEPVFIRRETNGFEGLLRDKKKFQGWVRIGVDAPGNKNLAQ